MSSSIGWCLTNCTVSLKFIAQSMMDILLAQDMTQMAPMQVLVAKDLSGKEWRFHHRLLGELETYPFCQQH
jgi:hypothetical protein